MPFARVNGVNLAYELHGTGDPLVLIHGAQSDRSIFANLLPDFVDRFRVLIFDQRGSGQSEKPDIEYTIGMIADDTAELMDHLDFSPAHVYGVSMGGMIAQELAIRHGAAVRSLVLGVYHPWRSAGRQPGGRGGPEFPFNRRALRGRARPGRWPRPPLPTGYVEQHPELIPALIEARKKQPLDPVGFAHRMKAAYRHDTFDRLSRITCPTLVITGKDDALIAWENSQLLAEHIADSDLVVLEPAGHVFWVEQPERSREAILTFLQKQKG